MLEQEGVGRKLTTWTPKARDSVSRDPVQKAGGEVGKDLNLAWGASHVCRRPCEMGEGAQPAGATKLELIGTLCIQPPSDGAVTEATEEVGCPATMLCPSPSLLWPFLSLESSVSFLDCVHV